MTPLDRQLAPPGGWHPWSATPRIAPKQTAELSPMWRAVLWAGGKFANRRMGIAQVPQVFLLLMRHRTLFRPWLRFASRLMPYGTLDRRDTELVILRVGWNCRSRYEWGQHVQIGLRSGLAADDIKRVAQGPDAPGWSEKQSALLRATDELHRDHRIADATWATLSKHYKERQLLEIGMLAGAYAMLAGVLNSAGLALEPEMEAALAEAPIHSG
jgi:alkylhydroperoxidase family enzyme